MTNSDYTLAALAVAVLVGTLSPMEGRAQAEDNVTFAKGLFDQLEYAPAPSERPVSLEAVGWVGGDFNRLWLRAEGEQSTLDTAGDGELEALYGRLISPYFDVVGGARLDRSWEDGGRTRGHLAVGVQGRAPYQFEVEPTLYVSQNGNVSARFEAAYSFLFTQRLVLEPEVEVNAALQDVPEWGVGAGVNNLNLGLRMRYEFHRKFAPYVGYDHDWRFGETADFAGGDISDGAFLFGVRMWR